MIKKRVTLTIISIALILVIPGLIYLIPLVNIGLSYKAKMLCSGVFISGRTPDSVLSVDLAADNIEVMNRFDSRVDFAKQQVVVEAFGVFEKTYQYRQGLGCTQLHDDYPLQTNLLPPPNLKQAGYRLEGVDKLNPKLEEVVDWAFSEPDKNKLRRTRAIVVLHKGRIVAERYAEGVNQDMALQGWSLGKSVINALVGILVKQGKLHTNMPSPVAEWHNPGDPRIMITLDHLLHMESGLEFNEKPGNPLNDVSRMLFDSPNVYAFAADRELVATPGTTWQYTSGTTNIISGILHSLIGDPDYIAFPRRYLFNPLGMEHVVLEPDAAGNFVGSSFIYASARDWAKFGQLYVQDGVWQGQRILPEGWVEYSRSPAKSSPDERYAAHFWLSVGENYSDPTKNIRLPEDTFHAIGRSGQFVTIIPSQELVVVRLGLTKQPGAWQHDTFIHKVLGAL